MGEGGEEVGGWGCYTVLMGVQSSHAVVMSWWLFYGYTLDLQSSSRYNAMVMHIVENFKLLAMTEYEVPSDTNLECWHWCTEMLKPA